MDRGDRIVRWLDRRSERFWWIWLGICYLVLEVVIYLLLVMLLDAA